MTVVTFEDLYKSRCTKEGKPHFWNPQPMTETGFCVFSNEDSPVEYQWGVDVAIQRVLALGYFLELPVGEWISELSRKESKKFSDSLKLLLKSNIRDEAAHFKGFEYAIEKYPISDDVWDEAKKISDDWLNGGFEPIESACFAETGVFLCSLSILRLVGGSELANMAREISRDESRHVATNRGVMALLGMDYQNPSTKMRNLIKETLGWLSEGLSIPSDVIAENFDFNGDFLIKSSTELIEEGIAEDLNSLLDFGVYKAPFENSNASLYSRVVLD